MRLGIIRLYCGESGKKGYYSLQELGLARELAKYNIEIVIFFLVDHKKQKIAYEEQIDKNIKIVYYPALKLSVHGIVNPKFISKYGIDVVHLLSDNQIGASFIIKYCIKKQINIYTYIGTLYSDTNNRVKRIFMSLLNQYNIYYYKKIHNVTKTFNTYKQLKSNGIENVQVIPVGLDLNNFSKVQKSKEDLRRELSLPINKKVLLFVGRLEKYKNPLFSLDLISEMLKQSEDYHLVIIGDGSMKAIVEDKIRNLNIDKSTTLIRKVANLEINKYYLASDIFLNLNNKEIFGMSILEAMYNKCSVVAITAPGPRDIINNNEDGVLLTDFNLDTWINAIEKSINDSELAEKAHEKILRKYSWNEISMRFIRFYEDLIGEKYEEIQSSNSP